jgi:hypothetical protein
MKAMFNRNTKFIKEVTNTECKWTNNPHEGLLFDESNTELMEGCVFVNVKDVQHLSKSDLVNDFSITAVFHENEQLIEKALSTVTNKKWKHTKGILRVHSKGLRLQPMGHDNIYNYITAYDLPTCPIILSINELSEKFYWGSENKSEFYSLDL